MYSVVFDASAVSVIVVGKHAVAAIVPGMKNKFEALKIIMIGQIKMSRLTAPFLRTRNTMPHKI